MKRNMKKLLGVVFSLLVIGNTFVSAQCSSYVSPEPTCIRVMANGDVEIDFSIASMGGATAADIDRFELFYSQSCATKVNVAAIIVPMGGFPTSTFTHVGANANNADACYHIVAYCRGMPTTALTQSTNIKAVRLNSVVSNDFEVALSWNWDEHSSGLLVNIERAVILPVPSAPVNIASPIYQQSTMSYTDTFVACTSTLAYQVKLSNIGAGCTSQSSIDTVTIIDNTPPTAIRLDSVTHDISTGRPKLGWRPSPSLDTKGYIIYRHINGDCGNNEIVDSVSGRLTTTKIDLSSSYAGNGPAQYSIVPYDECGNAAGFNGICVKSMFVTPTLDVCQKSVRLDWNHYEDFASGTDVLYKIFVSIGGSNYVFIDQVTENFYIHEDPIENTILTYKIVAVENGGAGPFTATSNYVNVDAEFLRQPDYEYLRYATVAERNYVQMELFTNIDSDVDQYILKRALDTSMVYSTVNVFYAPKRKIPADSVITMNDRSAITDQFQYFYKVDLYDSCGAYMSTSNVASTMLLKIVADPTKRVNRLEWTNVLGWKGETFAYKIYRFLDGAPLRDPLTKFPDSGRTTVFYDSLQLINDNITGGNPSQGEYCYYIEAIENEPSFNGVPPARSYSNEVCVTQLPYATVPNAFSPNGDGKNERFRPVVIYHDISSYEFKIVNRWGEMIYKTNNVSASWDGTKDGRQVPQGVYVYTVRYKASSGQEFEKVGTVTLVR